MGARFKTIAYTIGAAPASLESIVNSAGDTFISSLTLRAGKQNVADIRWTDSAGAIGGYLEAREAATFDLAGKFIKTSDLYIAGTASDVVYITVIS